MVIVFRPDATPGDIQQVVDRVTELGLKPHLSQGESRTIVGCIGDEGRLRDLALLSLPGVDTVLRVEKPYKLASREFAARRTVIPLGRGSLGDGDFAVIAGQRFSS